HNRGPQTHRFPPERSRENGLNKTAEVLTRGLNARHIRFIALGSAIGTGLFYGSAEAIHRAGPSVLLAYLIGGAAIYIVLRALGEMAVSNPVSGSFGEYASKHLGPLDRKSTRLNSSHVKISYAVFC